MRTACTLVHTCLCDPVVWAPGTTFQALSSALQDVRFSRQQEGSWSAASCPRTAAWNTLGFPVLGLVSWDKGISGFAGLPA